MYTGLQHTYQKVHQMSKHMTFNQKKLARNAKKMTNAARKQNIIRGKITTSIIRLKYGTLLMQFAQALQLSQDRPADARCPCDKPAVLWETVNEQLSLYMLPKARARISG